MGRKNGFSNLIDDLLKKIKNQVFKFRLWRFRKRGEKDGHHARGTETAMIGETFAEQELMESLRDKIEPLISEYKLFHNDLFTALESIETATAAFNEQLQMGNRLGEANSYVAEIRRIITDCERQYAELIGNTNHFGFKNRSDVYKLLRARKSDWDPDTKPIYSQKNVSFAIAVLICVIDFFINFNTNALYQDVAAMDVLGKYLMPVGVSVALFFWILGCAETHHLQEKRQNLIGSIWLKAGWSLLFISGVVYLSAFVLGYRDGGVNTWNIRETFPLIFQDAISTIIVVFTVTLAYFPGYSHYHDSLDPFQGSDKINRPDIVEANASQFRTNQVQLRNFLRDILKELCKIKIFTEFVPQHHPDLNPDAVVAANPDVVETIINNEINVLREKFYKETLSERLLFAAYQAGFISETSGHPRRRWIPSGQNTDTDTSKDIRKLGWITQSADWLQRFLDILDKKDEAYKKTIELNNQLVAMRKTMSEDKNFRVFSQSWTQLPAAILELPRVENENTRLGDIDAFELAAKSLTEAVPDDFGHQEFKDWLKDHEPVPFYKVWNRLSNIDPQSQLKEAIGEAKRARLRTL